jgi:CDGSH-type Zn-finger protein
LRDDGAVAIAIEPLLNGPYLVKSLETLTNSKGDALPTKDVIALCRCGCSTTKPFCSGMHKEVGLDSANLSDGSLNRRVDYEGDGITIHDNRGICAHSGFCTDNLRAVWRLQQEPWIDPHGAGAEEIAAVVRMCPSGALSHSIGGTELRDQERGPAIFVSQNGPYFVTGGIELVDGPWGEGASREHYTLCRCGGSKNKPFCDGTHWSLGFRDPAP